MPTSIQISVDSLRFDCLVAGDSTNPAVILLHGFPESSYMWRRLMDELATQGYYCIAPDLRGYSPLATPSGKMEYSIDKLSNDVLGLADTLPGKFHLIGHDWGAAIGWDIAFHNPHRLISYTALSVPHHRAFGRALHIDAEQRRKSRYMLFFLLPFLPEIMIQWNDFAYFRKLWKEADEAELAHNLEIFRRKKSLTAALNYYRANKKALKTRKIGEIQVPSLLIWGNKDIAIGKTAALSNEKYMPEAYEFVEIEGGHWLIQSNYPEVRVAILKQLESYSS